MSMPVVCSVTFTCWNREQCLQKSRYCNEQVMRRSCLWIVVLFGLEGTYVLNQFTGGLIGGYLIKQQNLTEFNVG